MGGSTLLGRRCPRCNSFVKQGLERCPVCGYYLSEENVKQRQIEYVEGGKKCPKCGTVNPIDARFCGNCGYRFEEENVHDVPRAVSEQLKQEESRNLSKIVLNIKWIENSAKLPSQIPLTDSTQIFDAAGTWEGFGFGVFKKDSAWKLLIRKTKRNAPAKMYARLNQAVLVPSGTEFYLGAVGFQLLGTFGEGKEVLDGEKNTMKTVMAAPGKPLLNIYHSGSARIRILNLPTTEDQMPVSEKIIFGRSYILNHLNIDERLLMENGVSGEHITIIPFGSGMWLINPLKGKYFYIEVLEDPLILENNTTIRYLPENDYPVDGVFTITQLEG